MAVNPNPPAQPANPVQQAPAQPQPEPPGYIEKTVLAIRDFIVSIFNEIRSLYRRWRSPPPPPPVPPAAAPVPPNPHQEVLDRLHRLEADDLTECFRDYYPSSIDRRKVYIDLALALPVQNSSYWDFMLKKKEKEPWELGQEMAQRNPRILAGYIYKAAKEASQAP